jgi:hypothetical protein
MNTKANVTENWKTYVSVFWTYTLWFERSVPATRTRRCRFSSICDLSLYRTVERRVLSGEDNRKSFLVEEKTEEIWSLSSHLQPSAFLWKRKIRIDVGEEQRVWAWRDSFTVQYCLRISWPFYSVPFRLFCFPFSFLVLSCQVLY